MRLVDGRAIRLIVFLMVGAPVLIKPWDSDRCFSFHRILGSEGERVRLAISSLRSRKVWRFGQGEENDLFAGYGADVMVHGQHLDAGDLLDHRFHDRTGRLDQMGPHLLQQVPPFFGRERLDQLLLGGSKTS